MKLLCLFLPLIIGCQINHPVTHSAHQTLWDRTPLTVAGDGSHADSIVYVTNKVNRRLGFRLLDLSGVSPDIVVKFNVPFDPETWTAPGGKAYSRPGQCDIEISNNTTIVNAILEHEIGHCLGLYHDDPSDPESIMVPMLAAGENRRLTDEDRDWLWYLYGRGREL